MTASNFDRDATGHAVDALLSGGVWRNDGNDVILTYVFDGVPDYYASDANERNNFTPLTRAMRDVVNDALEMIPGYTEITFHVSLRIPPSWGLARHISRIMSAPGPITLAPRSPSVATSGPTPLMYVTSTPTQASTRMCCSYMRSVMPSA